MWGELIGSLPHKTTLLPSPWRSSKINFLQFPSFPEASVWSLPQVTRYPWGTTSCWALAPCISLILKLRKKISDARNIYRQKAVPCFHLHLFVLIIKGTCVTITKRDPSTCSLYASSWGRSKADISLAKSQKLWFCTALGKSLIQPQVKHESPLLRAFFVSHA